MSGATDEEGRRGTFPGGENGGCAAAAGGDPPPSLSSHAASWERSLRMRAVDVRNIADIIRTHAAATRRLRAARERVRKWSADHRNVADALDVHASAISVLAPQPVMFSHFDADILNVDDEQTGRVCPRVLEESGLNELSLSLRTCCYLHSLLRASVEQIEADADAVLRTCDAFMGVVE